MSNLAISQGYGISRPYGWDIKNACIESTDELTASVDTCTLNGVITAQVVNAEVCTATITATVDNEEICGNVV